MSDPVHSFRMENYADLGVFAESPYLRGRWGSDAPWDGTRKGDLVVQCLAQEFARVIAASRERVAALEGALRKIKAESGDLWEDTIAAALGEEVKDGE